MAQALEVLSQATFTGGAKHSKKSGEKEKIKRKESERKKTCPE